MSLRHDQGTELAKFRNFVNRLVSSYLPAHHAFEAASICIEFRRRLRVFREPLVSA
jgi:hypothetical protein